MSRITVPAIATATGATAEVYAQVKKIAGGTVPNLFAAVGHVAPATLAAVLNAEGALASGQARQGHVTAADEDDLAGHAARDPRHLPRVYGQAGVLTCRISCATTTPTSGAA